MHKRIEHKLPKVITVNIKVAVNIFKVYAETVRVKINQVHRNLRASQSEAVYPDIFDIPIVKGSRLVTRPRQERKHNDKKGEEFLHKRICCKVTFFIIGRQQKILYSMLNILERVMKRTEKK